LSKNQKAASNFAAFSAVAAAYLLYKLI